MKNEADLNNNENSSETRCMRCGKHEDELEPFSAKNRPAEGQFEGQKLVKSYREVEGPPTDPELEDILSALSNHDDFEAIERFYGPDMVEKAIRYEGSRGNWEESWECRVCISEEGFWRPCFIDSQKG